MLMVTTLPRSHGLVATTATSDDADDGPVLGGVELLDAGGLGHLAAVAGLL